MLAKLLEHGDAKLRLDVLQRAALPVSDAERVLMPAASCAMGSAAPDESAAAAAAVFATYAGREAERVGEAVGRLLPNRRAVRAAVAALGRRRRTARTCCRRHARSWRPWWPTRSPLRWRARLAMQAAAGVELAGTLATMAAAAELHADAVAAAIAAVDETTMWTSDDRWDAVAAARPRIPTTACGD